MEVKLVANVAHLNYEQRLDLGRDIQACMCVGDNVLAYCGARLTGKRNCFFIDGTASKDTVKAMRSVICKWHLRFEG